jgi:hypothetical protein
MMQDEHIGLSTRVHSYFGLLALEEAGVVTDGCKPELNSRTANTDTYLTCIQ